MDSQHSEMQDKDTENPRQRLRADLIVAMRDHHQRRRLRRRSLMSLILVISAGILAFLMFGRNDVPPAPPVARDIKSDTPLTNLQQTSPEIIVPRHSIITIVRTDPDILERYVTRPSLKVESISDETLLASLSFLGRPTGLIRYDGRVRLSNDVIDDLKIDDLP